MCLLISVCFYYMYMYAYDENRKSNRPYSLRFFPYFLPWLPSFSLGKRGGEELPKGGAARWLSGKWLTPPNAAT